MSSAVDEEAVRVKVLKEEEGKKTYMSYKVQISVILFAFAFELLSLGWVAGVGIIFHMDSELHTLFHKGAELDFSWISCITISFVSFIYLLLFVLAQKSVKNARKECAKDNKADKEKSSSTGRNLFLSAAGIQFVCMILAGAVIIANIVWLGASKTETSTNIFTLNLLVAIVFTVAALVVTVITAMIGFNVPTICNKAVKSEYKVNEEGQEETMTYARYGSTPSHYSNANMQQRKR